MLSKWIEKRLDAAVRAEMAALERNAEHWRQQAMTQRQMRQSADLTNRRLDRQADLLNRDLRITKQTLEYAEQEIALLKQQLGEVPEQAEETS